MEHESNQNLKKPFRSGFVTLVGRPNAGKSTLANTIVGQKVAITSPTAQTTRHRLHAIYTCDDFQIVFVDTPGLHKPHDVLGEELNESTIQALEGIDVVAFVVDASSPFGKGDEWVAHQIAHENAKKILVITKTDLVNDDVIEQQIAAAHHVGQWDATISVSAFTKSNIDILIHEIGSMLPEGPHWFPSDTKTDQPIEALIAEFIREKMLYIYHDEVPHSIGVITDDMDYDKKKDLERIYATVYVEHESQKGIVIGHHGNALKHVGIQARVDLEKLLGCHVFLDLHVKVRKNWRRDINQIQRFGYGQGE